MTDTKYIPVKATVGMVADFFDTARDLENDESLNWYVKDLYITFKLGLKNSPTVEEVQDMDDEQASRLAFEIRAMNEKYFPNHPQFATKEANEKKKDEN